MNSNSQSNNAHTPSPVARQPKRTIPQLRVRLREIAADLRLEEGGMPLDDIADEIEAICDESLRYFGGRKAKPRFPKLTEAEKEAVRATAAAHPTWSQKQIGDHHGTIAARVSEALNGIRGQGK